jgi:hypothetical protein
MQREHFMDVELPSEYPRGNAPPACSAQLPADFRPDWTADSRCVGLHPRARVCVRVPPAIG